ncbi:hypothetical protein PR048_023303 [Dryococelus australis]|uniref:Uncharacterized protein n=1 Tax=Dryococelus australis TaxID=614101 RepID=A0ABQ9GTR8_9NEOP|nr:hypothetical protein PR048_023303 [Dryococelus australis]
MSARTGKTMEELRRDFKLIVGLQDSPNMTLLRTSTMVEQKHSTTGGIKDKLCCGRISTTMEHRHSTTGGIKDKLCYGRTSIMMEHRHSTTGGIKDKLCSGRSSTKEEQCRHTAESVECSAKKATLIRAAELCRYTPVNLVQELLGNVLSLRKDACPTLLQTVDIVTCMHCPAGLFNNAEINATKSLATC